MTYEPAPAHVVQRARATYRVVLAAALIVAAAAGCSSGEPAAVAEPAPTATVQPGPDAFMQQLGEDGFGSKDTADTGWLSVGNKVCEGFQAGLGFGQQVQAYEEADAGASREQAEAFVRNAVTNLCPEHSTRLP